MMLLHWVRADGKLYCRSLALKNIKMTEVRYVTEYRCLKDEGVLVSFVTQNFEKQGAQVTVTYSHRAARHGSVID